MSGPVLTAALARLRADFDAVFPARDRASDGWIGDAAHQAEVSGHNPDDTPGVTAEYSDADAKAEVRAIDVDSDLRTPGVTMYDVIKRILATPDDLKRLKYIIFCPPVGPFGANVPTIWSKSNGWAPRRYTGASPHKEHAHLSGDPASDEDSSPWSLTEFEDDMAMSDVEWNTGWMVQGLIAMDDTIVIPPNPATVPPAKGAKLPNKVAQTLKAIAAKTGLTQEEITALAAQVAADVVAQVDVPSADENAAAFAAREAAADRARAAVLDGAAPPAA